MKLTGRPSLEIQAKHEAHVLDVAFNEFLSNGYKGTSFDAIARAAGVSRVTLYRRFQTKEGLFLAVGEHAVERLQFQIQHVEPGDREPVEVLTEYAATAYAGATRRVALAVVRMAIAERQQFPELARSIKEKRMAFLRPLTAYLQQLEDSGVITLNEPVEMAAGRLTDLCHSPYDLLLSSPAKTAQERQAMARRAAELFMAAYGSAGYRRPAQPLAGPA